MDTIVSRRHPLVARVRRLRTGRSPEDPALLLDGWHLVQDALHAGLVLEIVAVSGRVFDHPPPAARATLAALAQRAIRMVRVEEAVLDALSPVRTPTGIVAVAAPPSVSMEMLLVPAPALVLVAVGVQEPGNVGAMVRAGDAAGATGVLVTAGSADPWGWKALRGAMGSAFRLPILREPEAACALRTIASSGVRLLATSPRATRGLYDVDLRAPTAVLLGGEGAGLPPEVAALAHDEMAIPMRPGVDSLNVATAAAVVAYEARRQRTQQPRT